MSHYIEINGVPNSPQRVSLVEKSGTIGSSRSCQVPIAHAEVSDHALMIDVRGDDFWVQNLNPYSIYIGMEEVTPNAWAPWALDEPLQLTKSVSLSLGKEVAVDEKSQAAGLAQGQAKPLDVSKILQIVIIAVCVIGAPFILFAPKSEVSGVIDKRFDFNRVVSDLKIEADKNIEYATVRKYLQQAWMADRRFRARRPATVVWTYELLLNHRLVRENPDNNETLKEIADYAKRRLAAMRFGS